MFTVCCNFEEGWDGGGDAEVTCLYLLVWLSRMIGR